MHITRDQLKALEQVGRQLLQAGDRRWRDTPPQTLIHQMHDVGRDILRTLDEIRGAEAYEALAKAHGWDHNTPPRTP